MRERFTVILLLIVLMLAGCAMIAFRSKKSIGKFVSFLCGSLIPPVAGNMLIISTGSRAAATVGYYIYFLGMDLVMLALYHFTMKYCEIKRYIGRSSVIIHTVLFLDVAQYMINLFLGQAFTTEKIIVDDLPYYRLVPLLGQTFHRIIDYIILLSVIIVFVYMSLHTTKVYSEKYSMILLALILCAVWQTSFIFSRTPIDRSMIGFGVFGLLIFYFSLYYRPMKLLDRMLSNIASEMPEALFFFDVDGKCIWANRPGIELAEIENDEFYLVPERLTKLFGESVRNFDSWNTRRTIGTGDDRRYFFIDNHLVTDDNDREAGSFLSIRDNTDEERRLKREMFNATHDRLTGLYTREYLYQRIHEMLTAHRDTDYYVVFVDVKNFKIVNDIFSSTFGDFALKRIAEWISVHLSDKCVYGRLAGDTFGVLVPVGEFYADQLEEELSNFVVSDGSVEYHILIHLGVYKISRDTDTDVSVMFDRAHLALSTIRDEYNTHIAYYDDQLRSSVLWDQHITSQLRDAIAEMQLRPFLQPIVDTSGKVVGAEALARWIHPVDGFLPPGRFIPVFEKNGMIVEVDRHMWRCACEILSRWKNDRPDLFISVNISPKDFYFMDVSEEIKSLVKEYDIPPERLRIEITETVMMNDADDRMSILNDLREAGFIVEMDDFGSGYSSLNLLKDMPVDVLKIDMKFLSRSENGRRAQTILQNILNLSNDLGISSLTEGVETIEQYHMLADMNCKLFQGYYFSKPVPVDAFESEYM